MIIDNAADATGAPSTFDDLFRRAGVRHPQALALIDPPNRAHFMTGAPRRLTYAQADRAISALAARLRALDLPTDAVVALQLPNIVESVIALLGILRAGMIAAPLPLLWQRQDATAAMRSIGAKAIITCAHVGATPQAAIAMQVAADLFSIRHVCAFGAALPDGVTSLNEVFAADGDSKSVTRLGDPAAHIAVVNFDVTASGIVPRARNHRQLIAGGLGPYREARLQDDALILSTIPLSFAGMALSLLPWLLSGGTLALHHSFDAVTFAAQTHAQPHDLVVLPAATLPRLAEAGLLETAKTIMAVWRAPERLGQAELSLDAAEVIDVACFGEIGIFAGRRAVGSLASFPCGSLAALRAESQIETARSAAGTLMLRGLMVPVAGFPFGTKPQGTTADAGFIDTGYPCRFAADGNSLVITAPPAGLARVGGYRFVTRELDRLAESLDADATLVVLPHELTGERLAGHAVDCELVLRELQRRGVNPLITGAFRRPQAA